MIKEWCTVDVPCSNLLGLVQTDKNGSECHGAGIYSPIYNKKRNKTKKKK